MRFSEPLVALSLLVSACGSPVRSAEAPQGRLLSVAAAGPVWFHVKSPDGEANVRNASGVVVGKLFSGDLVLSEGGSASTVTVMKYLSHGAREFLDAPLYIHGSVVRCADTKDRTWCQVQSDDGIANLRASPSSQGAVVRSVSNGDWVSVSEATSGWHLLTSIAPQASFQSFPERATIHQSLLVKNIPLADLTFPPTNPLEVAYRSQRDNAAYPDSSCGVTSVSMLLNYMGNPETPDGLRSEYAGGGNPADIAMPAVFKKIYERELGYGWGTKSGTYADIRRHIDAGRPVVAHTWLTYSGHVILVTGYTAEGLIVNDPWGRWDSGSDTYASTNGRAVLYRYADLARSVPTVEGTYEPILGYEGQFWLSTGSRSPIP